MSWAKRPRLRDKRSLLENLIGLCRRWEKGEEMDLERHGIQDHGAPRFDVGFPL